MLDAAVASDVGKHPLCSLGHLTAGDWLAGLHRRPLLCKPALDIACVVRRIHSNDARSSGPQRKDAPAGRHLPASPLRGGQRPVPRLTRVVVGTAGAGTKNQLVAEVAQPRIHLLLTRAQLLAAHQHLLLSLLLIDRRAIVAGRRVPRLHDGETELPNTSGQCAATMLKTEKRTAGTLRRNLHVSAGRKNYKAYKA